MGQETFGLTSTIRPLWQQAAQPDPMADAFSDLWPLRGIHLQFQRRIRAGRQAGR